jgi:membrane protein YqaA with SNARE-associated domain
VTALNLPALSTVALYATTFLLALASGLIPFVINTELYLVGVALLTDASPAAMVALATSGQMLGKFALYQAGRGALNVGWVRRGASSKAATALSGRPSKAMAVLALSSVTGVPPFYAVSFAAGTLRLSLAAFLAIGTAGRMIRFAAVFFAPDLFR